MPPPPAISQPTPTLSSRPKAERSADVVERPAVVPPPQPAACPITTDEHLCVYCPTCGTRMEDTRCKLRCNLCGFFLSCADFY